MATRHMCNAWCGCFRPSAMRWWSESIPGFRGEGTAYSHVDVLRHMVMGKSADDMEALSDCFNRVVHVGERSASGRWCVCLSHDSPSAGEARGTAGSDGFSGLLSLLNDLESAADALPISWKSTERIFIAQGRGGVYGPRLGYYLKNLKVRAIDRWLEPRDPETGRAKSTQLAYFLMSLALGGTRTECRWPKSGSLVEREVFTDRYTASLEKVADLYTGQRQQEAA